MSNVYSYAAKDDGFATPLCDVCAKRADYAEQEQLELSQLPCVVCGQTPLTIQKEGIISYWETLSPAAQQMLEADVLPQMVYMLKHPQEFDQCIWDMGTEPQANSKDVVELEQELIRLTQEKHTAFLDQECEYAQAVGVIAQQLLGSDEPVPRIHSDAAIYLLTFQALHTLLHSVVRFTYLLTKNGYFDGKETTNEKSK